MKEIREGINEHIVSEKMRDILLLILNRIEDNSDGIDDLYQTRVKKSEMREMGNKIADLLGVPRSDI